MPTPPDPYDLAEDALRRLGNQLDHPLDRIRAGTVLQELTRDLLTEVVDQARIEDRSWVEIGHALGCTGETALARYGEPDSDRRRTAGTTWRALQTRAGFQRALASWLPPHR